MRYKFINKRRTYYEIIYETESIDLCIQTLTKIPISEKSSCD